MPSITWRYPPDQHSPTSIRSALRAIHQISIQQHLQDHSSVLSYRLPLGAIHHLAISNKSALSSVHPVRSTRHPAGHHMVPTNRAAHSIRPPFGTWCRLTEQCTVTATVTRPPFSTWRHSTDRHTATATAIRPPLNTWSVGCSSAPQLSLTTKMF